MKTSSQSSPDPQPVGATKQRRQLSAEKKFQVYLETQHPTQPVGAILRREGLFSTDLARIRQQVKEGALQRLSAKPGRQLAVVSSESYETAERETAHRCPASGFDKNVRADVAGQETR